MARDLRREMVLWLRAAVADLPEARQLHVELLVRQALTAAGLDGRFETQ
jgi:hypothetical protein